MLLIQSLGIQSQVDFYKFEVSWSTRTAKAMQRNHLRKNKRKEKPGVVVHMCNLGAEDPQGLLTGQFSPSGKPQAPLRDPVSKKCKVRNRHGGRWL